MIVENPLDIWAGILSLSEAVRVNKNVSSDSINLSSIDEMEILFDVSFAANEIV